MTIQVAKTISLYEMSDAPRVRWVPVQPDTYELEVVQNPVDPAKGGSWYRLKGTTIGAGMTWIEEMGNDPGKTGVTIIKGEVKTSDPQPQKPKKKKWF